MNPMMRMGLFLAAAALAACSPKKGPEAQAMKSEEPPAVKKDDKHEVELGDEEWKKKLTPEQYMICRRKGTEPPGSGKYTDFEGEGQYVCVACGNVLFASKTKFHSGTGWPSFWDPAAAGSVEKEEDRTHGMVRTEVRCRRCGAHLGHVFDDGPQPTGQRYCINSLSLDFVQGKKEEKK